MNDHAIRFRFGIFVLASLILLAVLTILFGGFPSYFKRTDSYSIIFGNAQGVAPGTPVRRSGVRIGEVRKVELDNASGKVAVEIRIDSPFTLRKGDRAVLVQGLLGGDSAIAFTPPEDEKLADDTPVPAGAVLQGVNPADAGALMQKAADLTGPVQEALIEIRKTFQSINKLAPVAEDTLKDFREIGKMARSVGPQIEKTSEEIRLLSKTTRDLIPEIRKTNDEIQLTARNWGKVGERADVLIRTNEGKIVKSIELIEDNLKRMAAVLSDENQKNFRETVKNVRDASLQFEGIAKETNGLIKDTRVTVKQLTETLKRAEEAMSDLQKMTKPFGDKGPVWFKNLDEASDNLNKSMRDIRELIRVVAQNDGTIQRLLSDPALYNNLNDSALMTTKILPRLDRVLRDVEIFADKLARHPELIGIGGVVRPSSGIKESPWSPAPHYRIYP